MLPACQITPDSLRPVVYVSPLRPLGILRVMVTDHGPIYSVDYGVPVAVKVGTHLKPAHRAPLLTLVGALAVQAPQIVRSLGLDKNEIAMRSFHSLLPLRQSPSVETAVLNGLAHMLRLEVRRPLEVGEGAGDLENPVIGPCRQREPRDRRAEQRVGTVRHAAEDADVPRRHVGVGVHAGAVRKPVALRRAGPVHALPDRLARLAAALIGARGTSRRAPPDGCRCGRARAPRRGRGSAPRPGARKRNCAADRRSSRTGIPALPFCHVRLQAQKPLAAAYPRELWTLGDRVRKRRLDLGLRQKDVAR